MQDPQNYKWLAVLMHYSDGVLPVGAYAHSMGLEGMVQAGVIQTAQDLGKFLEYDVMDALSRTDIPLAGHAWRQADDPPALMTLDELSLAARPSRQLREAASKIGKQQWRIYQQTWAKENAEVDAISWEYFQSPVVMGYIFNREQLPIEAVAWSLSYQTFSLLLQAALKLIPIGPRATQALLHSAIEAGSERFNRALKVPQDEIGASNPMWDLASAQHEKAPARMFLS
ncbi:urease accessory protein UreF [Rubritalea sp.]|uniref:urease accessory protein UreF n=1 Tax=Rubritalea sp. TaxID=2109375 RepID=UPI003EFB2E11